MGVHRCEPHRPAPQPQSRVQKGEVNLEAQMEGPAHPTASKWQKVWDLHPGPLSPPGCILVSPGERGA